MHEIIKETNKKKTLATDYRDLFHHGWTYVIMHKNIIKMFSSIEQNCWLISKQKKKCYRRSKLNGYIVSVQPYQIFRIFTNIGQFHLVFITLASVWDIKKYLLSFCQNIAPTQLQNSLFVYLHISHLSITLY